METKLRHVWIVANQACWPPAAIALDSFLVYDSYEAASRDMGADQRRSYIKREVLHTPPPCPTCGK